MSKSMRNGYERVTINGKSFSVHRIVAEAFCEKPSTGHDCVDHIDGDRKNNHYANLRWTTCAENLRAHRKSHKGSRSSYMGVSLATGRTKFRSSIMLNGKKHYLGSFDNEVDAAKAYDKKAIELGFPVERLNFS